MKRFLACLLVALLFVPTAFAEVPDVNKLTDEEARTLLYNLILRLDNENILQTFTDHTDSLSTSDRATLLRLFNLVKPKKDTSTASVTTTYAVLQKGDKGTEVQNLQKRLIELNYLSGSADGDYGNKTKTAVEMFQKEAGLTVNGIADNATQIALYASDAPIAKIYLDLDFKAISRDPDSYTGKNYQFTGTVLQVLEQDYSLYTLVNMRVATKGNYDNVVYVVYYRPKGEARILEDDRITVYGTCSGLYSYESVMGNTITLPCFDADTVTIK